MCSFLLDTTSKLTAKGAGGETDGGAGRACFFVGLARHVNYEVSA